MKFTNPFIPQHFDLVVTRHPPLVEWLVESGIVDTSTPVVDHAHAGPTAKVRQNGSGYQVVVGHLILNEAVRLEVAERVAELHNQSNVRGKHVLGVLPHHLSAQAASITEVQLDWSIEQRRRIQVGDLDIEDVAKAARGLHTYKVIPANAGTRPALAMARALREGRGVNAHYVKFITNDHEAILEVGCVDGYGAVQVDLYRGAMRTMQPTGVTYGSWVDPWTDAPWQMATRVSEVDGKFVNGPIRLVGEYPTDEVESKILASKE